MKGDRAVSEGEPAGSGIGGRFDPEGSKNPQGEPMLETRSAVLVVEAETGLAQGSGFGRGKPVEAVE